MNNMNLENIYKKNLIFIILMGITGFCFGLLDWESNLSDLVYLKYNNKLLISFISANIGTARIISTLFCIKINDSKKPNFIFISCMVICSLISIITAIFFDAQHIILFIIAYLLEVIVLEIFSGYHYAYTYNSLPEELAMSAHSKRTSIFKILQAAGITIAGYISAKFITNAFLVISILASLTLLVTIILTLQVKNFPKSKAKEKINIIKKLNIFTYTNYFRKWFIIRILGRFALSSLIVLLSLRVIDSGLSLIALKTVKSLLWIISGIGFFLSGYLIRKNLIVKGDIIIKLIIAILLPIIFIYPNIIFLIILLDGALNPFNTMSHLEMLRKDSDSINVPQKDMVINLAGYLSKMLSAYILLNINSNLAIVLTIIILLLSTLLEIKLYIKAKSI